MTDRAFEDLVVGDRKSFGSYTVTEEEILTFAEQYDPQEFHVDVDAAAESMFGELVASGWHSTAISMRILVDNFFADSGSLGSPGVESVTWPAPIRPGDTLSVTIEITDKRTLESDPKRGLVTFHLEMQDEDGETKLRMDPKVFFERRTATETDES